MTMIEMTVVKQVNAKTLKVEAGVRYWEDGKVNGVSDEEGNLIPCRSGDAWCPLIDIDTGVIQGWPAGTTAKLHYKVADAGLYTLLGDDGEQLVQRDGYVPKIMSPGGSGYGDYIIMSIGPDGAIEGWNADLSHFEGGEDD